MSHVSAKKKCVNKYYLFFLLFCIMLFMLSFFFFLNKFYIKNPFLFTVQFINFTELHELIGR